MKKTTEAQTTGPRTTNHGTTELDDSWSEGPVVRSLVVSGPVVRGPVVPPLDKFSRVKLFLCDVDGVLTDCSVFMDGKREMKQWNIQDGLGLRLLQRFGIKVGWISGRASPATEQRARDLQIDFLRQGKESKVAVVESLLAETGLKWADVCFMGDDLLDCGAMKRARVAVSVPDGCDEAKRLAHYVTTARGGHGAVREVVTLILKAQKKWRLLAEEYAR
ncbi:MAG: HAD-IIIA family hydrolase [Verrucomicrobia bacterium]|nr:HAD-IIIA family hydrolase [Verrucomicrobiota bacterium]